MSEVHVMADVETMGNQSDAAIVSIGAVKFWPDTGDVDTVDTFYTPVDLQSAIFRGGTINGETVYWWMQQSWQARQAIVEGGPHIDVVLRDFHHWFPDNGFLWGNGEDFDNPIIESALRRSGFGLPWGYNAGRDMRTMTWLVRKLSLDVTVSAKPSGVPHHALDDAKAQARIVCEVFSTLRRRQTHG